MKTVAKPLIKEFGNSASLIVAFAALQTIPPKNFKMTSPIFGQPFKSDADKCNVVCNAGGWIAQHPHFKAMGLSFEERNLGGKTYHMPVYKLDSKAEAIGYNALAYALEMSAANCVELLAPSFYPNGEATTLDDVLRRFKKFIDKAGGAASLKALLDSQKPPKVKKEKKIKPKKAKKVAKKAKKVAKKAAKPAKKVAKKAPAKKK